MKFKNRAVGIGLAIVILSGISISQLEAQSTLTLQSLSERIDRAFRNIWELERQGNTTASNLEIRISRLETRVASTATATRRSATPTRRRATATPTRPNPTATRVRPTATPVPVVPFVTITRPMNLRQGPDTIYPIVRVANAGEEFEITGSNSQRTWWRIEVDEESAWVYAAFVSATNADRIRSVPTPVPPIPTRSPTATPRPQTSLDSSRDEAYLYAAALVLFDQDDMGTLDEWTRSPDSQKNRAVELSATMLLSLSLWCGMSTERVADLIGENGKLLTEVGYTSRTGLPVRQFLMFLMVDFADENPNRTESCDELIRIGAISMVESE